MTSPEPWRWEYDPDAHHVINNVHESVVAQVEELVAQLVTLADLGVDITDLGHGPDGGAPGGLRRFDLPSGGWFLALPVPRAFLIVIPLVMPPLHLA